MDVGRLSLGLLGLAVLACIPWLIHQNRGLRAELKKLHDQELVHFATFHDFGTPPQPAHPNVPARVEGTYYRGNDERSPELFNGGNYLTSTFELSLSSAGVKLEHGAALSGEDVTLTVILQRAPHTPDFFFSEERMKRVFLSRQSDPFLGAAGPIPDRVDLATVQPSQRWRAEFPLGKVAVSGKQELKGIVYVFEEFWDEGALLGSRFHYAIEYDLRFDAGRLASDSDLWMGALYRTRKVMQWKLPLSEWFSEKPIPPLPSAGTSDPKLLGIDDDSVAGAIGNSQPE
jgi:hypothetical protein